jgi:hypothetical protein
LVVHALLVLTGRATPEAEILSKVESFPPSLSVEVLLDRPARPHKTIAILGDIHGGTPEEVNERLARKAREIGADAIVIMSVHDKTTTDWLLDDPLLLSSRRLLAALSPRKTQLSPRPRPGIKYLE